MRRALPQFPIRRLMVAVPVCEVGALVVRELWPEKAPQDVTVGSTALFPKAYFSTAPSPSSVPPVLAADVPLAQPAARVVRVIDGDTVVVHLDGNDVTVVLIGVDAPESVHPSRPVERFGKASAAWLRGHVEGKAVALEYEPGTGLDRFGRMLAYLRLKDGTDLDREIIRQGYGFAYTKYPF